MGEKKTVRVSRQAVELARLHVEAARKAGRKPEPGLARIATARPEPARSPAPAAVPYRVSDAAARLVGARRSTYTDRRPLRWRTVPFVVTSAPLPVPDHGRNLT